MAVTNRLGDTVFNGDVSFTSGSTMVLPDNAVASDAAIAANADIDTAKMAQRVLAIHGVDLTSLRVWNALHTLPPSAGATDDLALITGTLGTDMPMIQTGDLKAAGATTRYAAFLFTLPPEYDDGETIQLRLRAAMETTIADVTATCDVECYAHDDDDAVGADLVTTAALSMNSLTYANKDFTITPTGLVAGDALVVRIAIAINDAATATAVIGSISKVAMLLDTRG